MICVPLRLCVAQWSMIQVSACGRLTGLRVIEKVHHVVELLESVDFYAVDDGGFGGVIGIGKAKSEFFSAARLLSLDSCTAVSGNPSITTPGNPPERSTSTPTFSASMPMSEALRR